MQATAVGSRKCIKKGLNITRGISQAGAKTRVDYNRACSAVSKCLGCMIIDGGTNAVVREK